jgi:hypothetical protein
MANHLRNLLQVVNLAGDVMEQAVNLVTNDNLDLGCAVIEKSATEKVGTYSVIIYFTHCIGDDSYYQAER